MRNSMLWAVAAFGMVWSAGIISIGYLVQTETTSLAMGPTRYGRMAMHVLMGAYFAHLLARTIYLSVRYRTISQML